MNISKGAMIVAAAVLALAFPACTHDQEPSRPEVPAGESLVERLDRGASIDMVILGEILASLDCHGAQPETLHVNRDDSGLWRGGSSAIDLSFPEEAAAGVDHLTVLRVVRDDIAVEIVLTPSGRIISAGGVWRPPSDLDRSLALHRIGATTNFKFPWDHSQGTWILGPGYGHCACGYHAVDFNSANDLGKRVLNPARGIVSFSGWANGYGWSVRMLHGNAESTRVAHLRYNPYVHVRPGHDLLQGTKLGECGASGNATGPHIHFEYFRNGITAPLTGFSGYTTIVVGGTYASHNFYVRPPFGE